MNNNEDVHITIWLETVRLKNKIKRNPYLNGKIFYIVKSEFVCSSTHVMMIQFSWKLTDD